DIAWWAGVVCDKDGVVLKLLANGTKSDTEEVPAGGFAIAIHSGSGRMTALEKIKVGQIVTVHNVLIDAMRGFGGTAALKDAFITYADAPTAFEIEINVNEKEILTDGTKDVSGNWGSGAGEDNVLLIKNTQCKELPMNVTVKYDLGETKSIESVSMYLYHCANVMIGYPEGKAKISVSTDGTTYTSVGEFDFAAAELATDKFGTVENKFAFDAVDARYIKVEFAAGSNEAILGKTPAGGKIYWEFVSMTEFEVGVVKEDPIAKGDITGDGNIDAFDYQMLKAYVLRSYTEATADQIARMDLNGDESIDAFDYQMLKCVVLGTYQFD
ncbi:MAG: discoidin domain-containing protein, partial [Clostridiales bacterium]|nr:discoidin domain-containing protein [Candidatus Coliplasma caballi]